MCGVGGEVVRVWVYLGSLPYGRGLRYGVGSGGAGSGSWCVCSIYRRIGERGG